MGRGGINLKNSSALHQSRFQYNFWELKRNAKANICISSEGAMHPLSTISKFVMWNILSVLTKLIIYFLPKQHIMPQVLHVSHCSLRYAESVHIINWINAPRFFKEAGAPWGIFFVIWTIVWLGRWAGWGSCYSRAALYSNDSKTL